MAMARYIVRVLAVFSVLTVVFIIIVRNDDIKLGSVFDRLVSPSKSSKKDRPPLLIVTACTTAHQKDNCVTGRVAGLAFPICTYTSKEDPVVSHYIQTAQYWEPGMVVDVLKLLRTADASSVLIDVGTNVGAYSLAAVHAGHRVISLEPNHLTMKHLATSVCRGNVSHRITLLQNAVSNERTTLHLGVNMGNRGDSFLLPANYCRQNPNRTECREAAVQTVTLNDLLTVIKPLQQHSSKPLKVVMKVDVQGNEMRVFDPKTCGEFFRQLDVRAIQVEWNMIQPNYGRDPGQRAIVDEVLEFLYRQNYTVHTVGGAANKLNRTWLTWPADIMILRGQ